MNGSQVSIGAVGSLGLDPSAVDLMSEEVLAASLRRGASFLCPTRPGSLVNAVVEVLTGLPEYSEETPILLSNMLDALISYGDLLELPVQERGITRRLLFLGVPGFVRRKSSSCLLCGVRPEGAPLLAEDVCDAIECNRHVRLLRSADSKEAEELCVANGLLQITSEQWLKAPRVASPEEFASPYLIKLEAAKSSGEVEGLRIIDPKAHVTYYAGRWRTIKSKDSGTFVARRPQAFGADLWCVAQIYKGETTALIDLPIQSPLVRGADEAWRLQAAFDALGGKPQRFQVTFRQDHQSAMIDLFSPIPSWAQRRLDIIGIPLLRSRGALNSYNVARDEIDEELRFLKDMMWLSGETC